jgi:Mg2+/Co2+ transporter CorB
MVVCYRDMCIDALSLAGTKEVIQLLKKKHAILSKPMLRRVIMNLVFVPQVLPLHVNTLLVSTSDIWFLGTERNAY